MHADSGDQQELGGRVKPSDMDKFMLQNELQGCFIVPVRFLRHQNDRVQEAKGQRGGNAVGLAERNCAPQGCA